MLFFDLFRNDPTFIKVAAGDRLFSEGDRGDVMYVLISGEAEITMGGLSIEVCRAGDMLGEMAVIDDSIRSATVVAISDCEFAEIDRKRFQFLVDESPRFALDVMRVMAKRLKQCDARLLGAVTGQARIS